MLLIDCPGDGRMRGRAHGEEARGLVHAALEKWKAIIGSRSKLRVDRYVTAFLSGTGFIAALRTSMPDLLAEMHGIAEGAAVPFDLVAAYNFMDEQWWYDFESTAAAEPEPGCSVIAVVDSSNAGHRSTILAQNMDLPSFMDGSQLVLRIRAPGQPEALVLTSAGLVGLTGVNRAGVGVCVNTLMMLAHSRNGLPVAACLRGALSRESVDCAAEFLSSVSHASGQHYAVGSTGGVIGLECCAAGVFVSSTLEQSAILHTNHPHTDADIDGSCWEELERRGRIRNSRRRLEFLDKHVRSARTPADIKLLLADRTTPICVTPTPHRSTQTFGSVLFDLAAQQPPRASFCLGLPASDEWWEAVWS